MSEPPATTTAPDHIGSRRDRFASAPWTVAALAACGCVVVALVDPTERMVTPPCPLRAATGWWCPLCGATRAASRLLRGDVTTALRFNAVFVVLLPLAVLVWVAAAFPHRLRWLDPVRSRSRSILIAVVAVLGVFMVVRNLPFAATSLRYPGA